MQSSDHFWAQVGLGDPSLPSPAGRSPAEGSGRGGTGKGGDLPDSTLSPIPPSKAPCPEALEAAVKRHSAQRSGAAYPGGVNLGGPTSSPRREADGEKRDARGFRQA